MVPSFGQDIHKLTYYFDKKFFCFYPMTIEILLNITTENIQILNTQYLLQCFSKFAFITYLLLNFYYYQNMTYFEENFKKLPSSVFNIKSILQFAVARSSVSLLPDPLIRFSNY